MAFDSLTPRHTLPIGAVALLPLIWYALGSSLTAGVVSTVNVVIILACMYVAFSPVENGHGDHDSGGTPS
ncbi:cytochrome-ba3 oxidase subunit [Natrarchaeobaculum aegyptiacum]|uniref:Cytochrome-ba3 oxidase subunit n=1 Tax=Natrarchaeobaculum aegyptiacum TaxID=745377 RepID=A0A2Z2HQC9_9EURY|nr:cytochrome-ba3 oxidase subunit [Natrarchaeobaculum aegyptiacum]ARS89346.1 cytochrome-ba3 oxidase subunit [Natrarchaeobaculum aegyptiacum]